MRNNSLPEMIAEVLVILESIGIGINRTISISNTIKMIAKRKNRMEKGIRAV
jgi:hypothetical protein